MNVELGWYDVGNDTKEYKEPTVDEVIAGLSSLPKDVRAKPLRFEDPEEIVDGFHIGGIAVRANHVCLVFELPEAWGEIVKQIDEGTNDE